MSHPLPFSFEANKNTKRGYFIVREILLKICYCLPGYMIPLPRAKSYGLFSKTCENNVWKRMNSVGSIGMREDPCFFQARSTFPCGYLGYLVFSRLNEHSFYSTKSPFLCKWCMHLIAEKMTPRHFDYQFHDFSNIHMQIFQIPIISKVKIF